MKKIFLVLLLTSFSFIAKSQKSYFGIDAGINIATQRVSFPVGNGLDPYSTAYYYENIILPTFSIFYQYNVSNIVGVRANVRYMGLGYTLPQTNNSFTYIANYNININYL